MTRYAQREDIIGDAARTLEFWAERNGSEISAGDLADTTGLYPFQIGHYAQEIVERFNSRNRRLRVRYTDRRFHITMIEA